MEEKEKLKELKRMRYFDGLFLDKDDYKLDQDYQRRLLQLHNRYMHTNGIVAGLEIIPSIAMINEKIKSDPNINIELSQVKCKVVTEEGEKIYYVPKGLDSENCRAFVSEGMALNLLSAEENENFDESTSQQIYICKDHPDSNINLEKYPANKDIFLFVSYLEENDKNELIRGQEQYINVWERGRISHSLDKPQDETKNIVIGKVMLGLAKKVIANTTVKIDNIDESKEYPPVINITNDPLNEPNETFELTDKHKDNTGEIKIEFTDRNGVKTTTKILNYEDTDGISKVVKTITDKNEKSVKTTILTTEDEVGKTVKTVTNSEIKDTAGSMVLWKKDGNTNETFKTNGDYTKKTNFVITEGNTKKVIDETLEKNVIKEIKSPQGDTTDEISDETTGGTTGETTDEKIVKKTGKITGTTTVTTPIEIKDEITGELVETKEIVIETKIDHKITEDIDEQKGVFKSITEGTNTVTTSIVKITNQSETGEGTNETQNQSETGEGTDETNNQTETEPVLNTIEIKIEETKIQNNGTTQITTVTTEESSEEKRTTIKIKTIVREVEVNLGIVTITTTVNTSGEIFDKINGIQTLIEPTTETVIEKDLEGNSENEKFGTITCNYSSEIIRYIQEVSCFDSSGNSVRKYSGPGGNELTIGKMVFKMNNQTSGMPFIRVYEEDKKIGLEVDSPITNFTGSVSVKGDLIIKGKLIDSSEKSDSDESELSIANSFVQVNGKSGSTWIKRDGGLQVYRGETVKNPDACLMWSEDRMRWQVGYKYTDNTGKTIDRDFFDIAYGDKWERLINQSIVDDLHKHSKLYNSSNEVALEVSNSGELFMNGNLSLGDKTVWLRSNGNTNHGLGWFGTGKTFGNIAVDGPVLFGLNGGILGTTENGQKAVVTWNSSGNVGIGVKNPIDDKLELSGTLRVLSDTNPIRFTPIWTALKDKYTKNAEISNDTTNCKALVIVGNSSAGQERRVAIWDRLDVNGYLYVNGDMQVTNAIKPSSGVGNNGIIFPKDPGGGSGDSAWLKYYAHMGEACNLEIGISNDANDNIALMASGNVGIGTKTPADKLDVNGNMRVLSGTNPIRFTSVWDGSSSLISNQAEICNDVTRYKSLILVGNKSSGKRKVSVWDNLDVNGSLTLNGDLKTLCAIVPSVGNGINNGISFPREYNGDKGDAAWIRYYSDAMRGGRENMTLEIGIGDDAGNGRYNGGGDRIRLYASGGVYVDGYFYYSSSRELKENITKLSTDKAKRILNGLNPVAFNFKGDTQKTTLGFISEEVPTEVAAVDQKAISPMEIVAVLTSVVKEQRKLISELKEQVDAMS